MKTSILRTLHIIRERYTRLPSLPYIFKKQSADLKDHINTLEQNGIIKIENLITPAQLAHLQEDFETIITTIKNDVNKKIIEKDGFIEHSFSESAQTFVCNNPFKYSPALVRLCLNKKLNQIITAYFKKPVYIHQAVASRYLPYGKTTFGSFQWHHDAWGKRINVMILLSDVGNNDQYMTYILKSHNLRYPYERYVDSRFGTDTSYAKEKLGDTILTYEAKGNAGDIFVFDPNGFHSGNRTLGRLRDAYIVSWSPDKSYIWKMELPPGCFRKLSKDEIKPFHRVIKRMSDQSYTSLFPRYHSWVESLSHLTSWV